jgi:hypothetical protein
MADSCRPSEIAAMEISLMSKPKQNRPGGKPGQPSRKLDPAQSQKPDHAPGLSLKSPRPADANRPVPAAAAAPPAAASPDTFSTVAAAPANTAAIDMQTIALAYGEHVRKSFEQTRSFVEKLAGVRSLDKAIEIQTEFAKQACETFVTDAQKIRELYSGLAKQTFEGAVAKMMPAAR